MRVTATYADGRRKRRVQEGQRQALNARRFPR